MSITLFKYCNSNLEDLDEQNYLIKGKQIKIKQDKNKGIGWTLWTCVLFHFLIMCSLL